MQREFIESIAIMIQALNIGREKGIYTFADLEVLINAINTVNRYVNSESDVENKDKQLND